MAKKILIIADEHILAGLYADRFRQEKWKVTIATTRDEGLKLTKKEKPDMILLDILLFNGNGIEYLKTKKDDETITKIPVVVFSNFDDSKTKEESLELGALEYLLKTDYTPQELLSRVSLYLK